MANKRLFTILILTITLLLMNCLLVVKDHQMKYVKTGKKSSTVRSISVQMKVTKCKEIDTGNTVYYTGWHGSIGDTIKPPLFSTKYSSSDIE